ncbi:HU family DNA-binding protein, partial [bacterium]|nr:HU family DNA-binding protein [bacterium]
YFRGFGSFKKVLRPPRKYRNFITGEIETRPAKKDIDFNPSKKLLSRI